MRQLLTSKVTRRERRTEAKMSESSIAANGRVDRSVMPAIHLYAPKPTSRWIRAGTCPDCKKRTRFLGWHYEWYGSDQVCLRCGREWSDGEWMPLPFMRGARAHNIAEAKARWRRGSRHNVGIEPRR